MAGDQDATSLDPPSASGGSAIVDQPRAMASTDAPNAAEHVTTPLLFILDGIGNKVPVLFEKAKDFSSFKTYVEEIYARMEDKIWLDKIRNDEFQVISNASDETHIILPSLWNDFVRPGMTVNILFSFNKRDHSARVQDNPLPKRQEFEYVDVDVEVGDGRFDGGKPEVASSAEESSIISTETDIEDDGSENANDDEVSESPTAKPIRAVVQPVDEERNPLSFKVDTRWAAKLLSSSKLIDSNNGSSVKKTRNSPREMDAENLKITKAITSTAENRTTLEVHTIPGPENSTHSSSIGIRWFHLHGTALDWNQFKATCMTIPDISERTRYLILKILHKIEKEYLKAFLGGFFIEPGTVLRGDECNQVDAQSVIFSCTPYFEIQKLQPKSTDADRLHPSRTLIQSYYPYEPVRERDEEQAYRSIGNARDNGLIHVPVLWMLNVAGRAVVTCSYGPVAENFTKSIRMVQEDLKHLSADTGNPITSIRLTVPDGRVLIYSTQECGTYFQTEQRIRELRRFTRDSWSSKSPHLILQQQGKRYKAIPSVWPAMISQRQVIFIDMALVEELTEEITETVSSQFLSAVPKYGSVPPFYHWPSTLEKAETHATQCLEKVEDAMLNEVLSDFSVESPVERTFTSTKYYEGLREDTFTAVDKFVTWQIRRTDSASHRMHCTHHQSIVRSESSKLPSKTHEFIKIVRDTLSLFVTDIDQHLLMRKIWGATADIAAVAGRLSKHDGYDSSLKEYEDPLWKTPITRTRKWRIRKPNIYYNYANEHAKNFKLPLPGDDTEFGNTLKRCRRCAREEPFDDPQAAISHLKKHAAAESKKQGDSTSSSLMRDDEAWKDWIRNDDQALLETTVAGAGAILDRAIEEARKIYEKLQELADGVRDEQGNLSTLYSLPRKLLGALHHLMVFYFSVERSMHFTEQCFLEKTRGGYQQDYPYTDSGLRVLSNFRESVELSVTQARDELCEMVRSATPNDATERLSFGTESISSWLIRRLIVKPLEKSMTIGDMYREYLSTLAGKQQFQVNHRPGKRLLRSINLLQEELTILAQVNDWQTRLVTNYMALLDDATYPVDLPTRRALFPYERVLLNSCLDNLALTREEYEDQIRRCGPLSNSTKQSAEITEEDHGKAILVFTIVTVIFLPLSFVTSFLGMNVSDIRDMESNQTLFWAIAIPLTIGIMAVMMFLAYNGDEIRDFTSATYRSLAGKQDRRLSARGISVLQRKQAANSPSGSLSTLSMADEAEYAAPRARPTWNDEWYSSAWDRTRKTKQLDYVENDEDEWNDEWNTSAWERMRKTKQADFLESNVVYREEIQPRHVRASVRKPAFPPPEPDAAPVSYVEPTTYAAPASMPPPSPPMLRTKKPTPHVTIDYTRNHYDRPSQRVPVRPTYMRINTKHVVPAVLDEAQLPWDFDENDPNYVIIRRHLQQWDTDELFEKSKEVAEGRTAARVYSGRYSRPAGGEYVWRNKKAPRRKIKSRRRFEDDERW